MRVMETTASHSSCKCLTYYQHFAQPIQDCNFTASQPG